MTNRNEKSELIAWDTAITMIKRYRDNEHDNAIPHFNNSMDGFLNGFEIDAKLLRDILENPDVNKVHLAFGRHDRIGGSTTLSTIFFGTTQNGEILKELTFDYCKPCPTACSDELESELGS